MIKKLILFFTLFLVFFSNKAFADWEKFGETESATYYINFNEIEFTKLPYAPKGKKIKACEVIINLTKL